MTYVDKAIIIHEIIKVNTIPKVATFPPTLRNFDIIFGAILKEIFRVQVTKKERQFFFCLFYF